MSYYGSFVLQCYVLRMRLMMSTVGGNLTNRPPALRHIHVKMITLSQDLYWNSKRLSSSQCVFVCEVAQDPKACQSPASVSGHMKARGKTAYSVPCSLEGTRVFEISGNSVAYQKI